MRDEDLVEICQIRGQIDEKIEVEEDLERGRIKNPTKQGGHKLELKWRYQIKKITIIRARTMASFSCIC